MYLPKHPPLLALVLHIYVLQQVPVSPFILSHLLSVSLVDVTPR